MWPNYWFGVRRSVKKPISKLCTRHSTFTECYSDVCQFTMSRIDGAKEKTFDDSHTRYWQGQEILQQERCDSKSGFRGLCCLKG